MSDRRGGRRRRGRSGDAGDGATGLAEQVEVVEVVGDDAGAARDRRADDAGSEREGAPDARGDDADVAPAAATTEPDAARDVPPSQQGVFASRRSGWPAVPAWLQTLLVFVVTAVLVFLVITALGAAMG